MKAHLLLVILALSVSLRMAQASECASRRGVCRASGKRGCVRLQGECDNDQVCCQKNSRLEKRKCRQKRRCTKEGGECIPKEESCLKITSDDLCKGASCKCCLGDNPSCTTTPGCQLRGGFCFRNSGGDLCADGTVLSDECEGAKCACCIPKTGSCQCGVANDVRIIGGEEISPPNKFPWLVGMLQPKVFGDQFFCGGSIISRNYVLTAAHCLLGDDSLPLPAKEFQVGIANHNFNSEDDDIQGVTQAVDVKSYVIHEDYVPEDFDDNNNDIALLLLKETLDLTSYPQVRPVCLPDPNTKYEGQKGTVVGWGDTKNGKGAYPDAAREVDVPIKDCKRKVAGVPITPQMMCAGRKKSKNKGAKGACFGDSGGPLFVKEGGKYTQVGIVSFGGSCLKPAVFARVSEFLTWISDNTPGETYCQ
ncbi:putative trypsin-1-like [Penaeus vannamei]|uniref:Putative trypsin-1-like n=1 Tax=Penaeus vannamei TaxID=6689 RepID=A0A423SAJ9_PENVA|nr:venom protease-like [Penaeus vannamei]ROT61229.1 putative trypsin-1-like [Penaeus vannamei]